MYNFVLYDDSKLESLRKRTLRDDKADVIRDALAFYNYILERIENGEKIFAGKDNFNAKELDVTTFRFAAFNAANANK